MTTMGCLTAPMFVEVFSAGEVLHYSAASPFKTTGRNRILEINKIKYFITLDNMSVLFR